MLQQAGFAKQLPWVAKLFAGLVLVFLAINALFIYWCGYWENWPVLDTLSGPMRFRQFVMTPIPQAIHHLRGGYSGFPQGQVVTWFETDISLEKLLPSPWHPVEKSTADTRRVTELFADAYQLHASAMYQKGEDAIYLLLDVPAHKGVLYIP